VGFFFVLWGEGHGGRGWGGHLSGDLLRKKGGGKKVTAKGGKRRGANQGGQIGFLEKKIMKERGESFLCTKEKSLCEEDL